MLVPRNITGWWFQRFFIFSPILANIFSKGLKPENGGLVQMIFLFTAG